MDFSSCLAALPNTPTHQQEGRLIVLPGPALMMRPCEGVNQAENKPKVDEQSFIENNSDFRRETKRKKPFSKIFLASESH